MLSLLSANRVVGRPSRVRDLPQLLARSRCFIRAFQSGCSYESCDPRRRRNGPTTGQLPQAGTSRSRSISPAFSAMNHIRPSRSWPGNRLVLDAGTFSAAQPGGAICAAACGCRRRPARPGSVACPRCADADPSSRCRFPARSVLSGSTGLLDLDEQFDVLRTTSTARTQVMNFVARYPHARPICVWTPLRNSSARPRSGAANAGLISCSQSAPQLRMPRSLKSLTRAPCRSAARRGPPLYRGPTRGYRVDVLTTDA